MKKDNPKKNILVWSPFTSKVGTVQNIINNSYSLLRYSTYDQFNISLINVFGEWDNYIDEIAKNKINIHNFKSLRFIRKWNKIGFIKSRISYLMIFFFSFFPLFILIKKKRPDYLIIHLITSLPLLIFSFFNFRTKLILHVAGHPKLNFFRKTIFRFASKNIFRVICPSHELKALFLHNNIFTEQQMSVVEDSHLIVKKIKNLKKVKFDDDFFDDKKILISIGRMTKQKNYFFLIRNFKKLTLVYDDIKLLIIGDGEEKNDLIHLIQQLEIKDKVKLIDYDLNIYKYLAKSNFYISTSLWEGSSLAMVDAAFIGIPVLCSDCPSGRKEFIGQNERGFLYKQGDKEDFLNKFSIMYSMKSDEIVKLLINAKKETKKFTVFKNFLKLNEIFN